MENLSIEFQSTVKEIQKEVTKAIKLKKWPENKAKRVYNKAVRVFITIDIIFNALFHYDILLYIPTHIIYYINILYST